MPTPFHNSLFGTISPAIVKPAVPLSPPAATPTPNVFTDPSVVTPPPSTEETSTPPAIIKALLLNGTDGNDLLNGGAGNDTLNGGYGDDQLHGQKGNDLLNGGAGNDTLYGDAGNDVLNGALGNDLLFGGDGNDRLDAGSNGGSLSARGVVLGDQSYGGAGQDIFVFDAISRGPSNVLGIMDFQSGVDKIEIHHLGNDTMQFDTATIGSQHGVLITFHGEGDYTNKAIFVAGLDHINPDDIVNM